MRDTKLLFIDTETGGLEPDSASLLSVGLVYWHSGVIQDKVEFFLKEMSFKATKTALEINKINLEEHREKAVEHQEAIKQILKFCYDNFGEDPVILVGHNISFDVAFLKYLFLESPVPFRQIFSHRTLDTASILKFLSLTGVLQHDVTSSDKAFEFFSIPINQRHSALEDALATANLFNELIALVKTNCITQ